MFTKDGNNSRKGIKIQGIHSEREKTVFRWMAETIRVPALWALKMFQKWKVIDFLCSFQIKVSFVAGMLETSLSWAQSEPP